MTSFNKPIFHADQNNNSDNSSEMSETELEQLRKLRVMKKSNVLFNQQLIQSRVTKSKQQDENEKDTKKDRYMIFSQNEIDSQMSVKNKKKKKKRPKNPLVIFKNHKMPLVEDESQMPDRIVSRNIHELKFPKIKLANEDGDIRLTNNCEPYLRQIIFDHNQVKKVASTPQFDAQMIEYRQKLAEYKQWIDNQDEIHRIAALNKFGDQSGNIGIQPKYNLRSIKLYPPQQQAENMYKNYIPPSQLLAQNQEIYQQYQRQYQQQQSKPRFLPIIPLRMY